MQTIVRLIVGFVTHTLGQKAPTTTAVTVDTTAADEAWWDQEIAEEKANWLMEKVSTSCIRCAAKVTIARWQASNEGDECNKCIAIGAERYQDFLDACKVVGN